MNGQNFYNQNSTRRYPLDDAATAETDDGVQMPSDILVDCYITYPSTVGTYLFISSLYASANVVSLTLLAADQPARISACGGSVSSQTPSQFTPIAAVTVNRSDLEEGRQYALNSMYPGVGGWVVFGPCRQVSTFRGLFSSVSQSQLAARVCHAYEPFPVPRMGRIFQDPALTGLVQISGGLDVTVRKVQREIEGVVRDVLAVALDNRPDSNTLETYKGPCQNRPESGNCLMPPIESINEVVPDCSGNIDIELVTDCGDLVPADAGLLIDYCLGLSDACTKDRGLPVNGKLPNDHDDYCEEDGGWSSQAYAEEDDLFYAFAHPQESSQIPCVAVPYEEAFQDDITDDFAIHSGSWSLSDGLYKATDSSVNNISLFTGCNFPALVGVPVGVEVSLPSSANEPNGGLIFDYKENDNGETYYVAQLEKSKAALTVKFWNGRHFVVVGRASRVPVRFESTYAITLETADAGSTIAVTCELRDGHLNGTRLARVSFNSARITSGFGYVGLQAYHSQAYFLRFALGEFTTPIVSSQEITTDSSQGDGCDLPYESIIGYWSFESGDLGDDVGDADFEAFGNNDPIAGPYGRQATSFDTTAFAETLETNNFPLAYGPWSISGWVRFREVPTAKTFICGQIRGRRTAWMLYADSNNIYGVVSPDGLQHVRCAPDSTFSGITADTWYHFNFWYDDETRQLHIEIDNDDRGTTGYSKGVAVVDYQLSVARKPIEWLTGVPMMAFHGLTIFNAPLTDHQRTCLYTSGVDRTRLGSYVSNPAPATNIPAPYSFWPLNESGTANREDVMLRFNLRPTAVAGATSTTGLIDAAANLVASNCQFYSGNFPVTRELFPVTAGALVSFAFGGWIRGNVVNSGEKCLGGIWMNSGAGRVYGLFMTAVGYKGIISFNGYDEGASSEYDEIAREGSRTTSWRHVMMSYNATTDKVTTYFNGKPATASMNTVTTLPGGSQPFTIGGASFNDIAHPEGYGFGPATPLVFDDWGFWRNVLLSNEQILAIYNNGLGWQPDV